MILLGDALTKLKNINTDSIDLICTDPPYGYQFMNKNWDKAVIGVETWKECLRVLKPGAFAFIMSSPRQDVFCKMMLNLIEAGFRTDFSSIYWTYASGFPKAADVSKLVDKRNGVDREVIQTKSKLGSYVHLEHNKHNMTQRDYNTTQTYERINLDITKPATEQAKQLEGSYAGFQPKPAVELVLVVMKPLNQKSYVDQALDNQKGITWLDDCRIPYQSEQEFQGVRNKANKEHSNMYGGGEGLQRLEIPEFGNDKGRFPANLLVEDDVLNDGQKHDRSKMQLRNTVPDMRGGNYGNYKGKLTIDKSYISDYGDSGSFSRYFSLDSWAKTLPFLIVPKASKSEKNKGLDSEDEYGYRENGFSDKVSHRKLGGANYHPTVKPLKLMSYLITMGSREGDIILDPFCGSGTTLIAAHNLHRKFIGIEINEEYCNIARKRLEPYLKQSKLS